MKTPIFENSREASTIFQTFGYRRRPEVVRLLEKFAAFLASAWAKRDAADHAPGEGRTMRTQMRHDLLSQLPLREKQRLGLHHLMD